MVIAANTLSRRTLASLLLTASLLCLHSAGNAENSLPLSSAVGDEITIVGLRQQIDIVDDHSTEANMAALWQRFQDLQALHYAINWSLPVELFALYTGFESNEKSIEVTLGYAEHNLFKDPGGSDWARQAIAINQFVSRPARGDGTDDISSTWQLLSGAHLPVAILERYQLDATGAVEHASILLKY